MAMPTAKEVYADGLRMWYDLCPACWAAFQQWRDAPNPGPWNNPEVQKYPQLMAFLAGCRVTGPSPEQWRETVAWQLMLIRRICTDQQHEVPQAKPARAVDQVSLP